MVLVHFGGKRPLVYMDEKVNVNVPRIHVECLNGGHYNWVKEHQEYVVEWESQRGDESGVEEMNGLADEYLGNYKFLYESSGTKCVHGNMRDMRVEIRVGIRRIVGWSIQVRRFRS